MIKRGRLNTIIIIFLLLFLSNVSAVFSLSQLATLKELKVSVWPEYDRANEALIMFRGQLPSNIQLPAKIRFLIPNNARLSSTSSIDNNNKFQYTKEWQSKKVSPKGDFSELTYNVYYHTFQFEIYDQVDTQKDKRQYNFPLKTAMDIDNLSVEIQQPLRSNNFKVSPKNAGASSDDKGFHFRTYDIGKIRANTQKTFSATYAKSDTKPSVEGENAQPVDTSTNQVPGILFIIITVAALLAILIAVFLRSRKKTIIPGVKKPRSFNKKPSKPRKKQFCTQCGSRLNSNSSFCHTCGKKL